MNSTHSNYMYLINSALFSRTIRISLQNKVLHVISIFWNIFTSPHKHEALFFYVLYLLKL